MKTISELLYALRLWKDLLLLGEKEFIHRFALGISDELLEYPQVRGEEGDVFLAVALNAVLERPYTPPQMVDVVLEAERRVQVMLAF